MTAGTENQRLREALEEAAAAVGWAGDWMQQHRGLDHYGYASYEKAAAGISELLSHLPECKQ